VENDKLFRIYKAQGYNNAEISDLIAKNLDVAAILTEASKRWDGGYVMGGLIGHGDAFVLRDPNGIRPAFYYHDDEIAVVCSERPIIQTVFDIKIKEVKPGYAVIIKKDGTVTEEQINEPQQKLACSFERIYFSRGNDAGIYSERHSLGSNMVEPVLKAIN